MFAVKARTPQRQHDSPEREFASSDPADSLHPRSIRESFDIIRTSIYDKCRAVMNSTTHLDHISHCTAPFGTTRSNRWTN